MSSSCFFFPCQFSKVDSQKESKMTFSKLSLPLTLSTAVAEAAHHRLHRTVAAPAVPGTMQQNGTVWPDAVYWTNILVGTPPVSYAVTVDGGSGSLYLQKKGCKGCTTGPPNTAYDPSASSTSSSLGTPFQATYGTCVPQNPDEPCTIKGHDYEDVVSFEDVNGNVMGPVKVQIGGIEEQTTNFYQFAHVDAILGMIPVGDKTAFQQLCMVHEKCDPNWGMCFNANGTKSTGTLTIGTIDEDLATEPLHWYQSGPGFQGQHGRYPFTEQSIASLSVAGQQVSGFKPQYALLDSGTNNVLLPFLDKVLQQMCADASLKHCTDISATKPSFSCFDDLTEADIAAYPTVHFNLGATDAPAGGGTYSLKLQPQDYWLKGSPVAPEKYCFSIGYSDKLFIIGDTLMRHYYQVYDYGYLPGSNAERPLARIGWGKVNKDRCGNL